MEWASHEVVSILTFLLPGFVAAWVFFALTAYPKPSEFERVVQALIFTVLSQGVVSAVRLLIGWARGDASTQLKLGDDRQLVAALGVAIVLGLLFSRWSNNDAMHLLLRRWGFTKQTSFPSEWFGAFNQHPAYVVLHLTGERRLYGWPEEWPSDPTRGHFKLVEAEWLDDGKRIPLAGVSGILVPVSEVSFVEFMGFPADAPRAQ